MTAAVILGSAAALVPHINWRHGDAQPAAVMAPGVGLPGAPPTTAGGLASRIAAMDGRLREQPGDVTSSVLLADALLRQARATNDSRPAARAHSALQAVLMEDPLQYDALRLLGAVHLTLHQFHDALQVARRARHLRPDDAWNYGVTGDALMELGDYEGAFEAIEAMMRLRPGPAAYARVSYARELRGDLEGAFHAMQMAGAATSAHDPEARAWYAAQTGGLLLTLGRLEDAHREFQRAVYFYPGYPHALLGQGQVKAARGDRAGARAIYLDALGRAPTVDLAARIGDLYTQDGETVAAERYYQLAEDLGGPLTSQTDATLALFLADHDRSLADAVRIAEDLFRGRQDIFTADALSWAYYKVGRLGEAQAASDQALRTGTRDPRLRARAAEIRRAWCRVANIDGSDDRCSAEPRPGDGQDQAHQGERAPVSDDR